MTKIIFGNENLLSTGGIDMYRVIYKGYSNGYQMSNEMTLEAAREFRYKCLKMNYPKENIHIIQIVE